MRYTLGTVCKLKGIDLELIIIGYNNKGTSNNYIYEYVGCLLKEGFTNSEKLYRFNREHIESILYEGYNKKEINKEEQKSTTNNDKEEYIFDENGILIEVKRPSQKQKNEELFQKVYNNSTPVILESIDINNL